MKAGNEYLNITTGAVIRVVEVHGPHEVTVITLVNSNGEETSQQRKRKMNPVNLHDTLLKDNGELRTSGWVLQSDTPPASTSRAVPAAKTKENVVTANISPGAQDWSEVDMAGVSTEILVQSAHRLDIQAKSVADDLDLIKAELKKRMTSGRGTKIAGESVMTVTTAMNFSPALARKKLSEKEVKALSKSELDREAVKKYLGEKSPAYQALLVPGAATVKFRMVKTEDVTNVEQGLVADPFTTEK